MSGCPVPRAQNLQDDWRGPFFVHWEATKILGDLEFSQRAALADVLSTKTGSAEQVRLGLVSRAGFMGLLADSSSKSFCPVYALISTGCPKA